MIEPSVLRWARESAGINPEDAAQAVKKDAATLEAWERGEDAPTIAQLRLLAAKYKRPLSVFYLPEPPQGFAPIRDFRRLPGEVAGILSPRLAFAIRQAHERRELALELYREIGEAPRPFTLRMSLGDNPEAVGEAIRAYLGVEFAQQRRWPGTDHFGRWRLAAESVGVLVFKASRVDFSEMRGLAIAADVLPVVVVNAKDMGAGGTFTLLHEIGHLVLGLSGICDLDEFQPRHPDEQRVEVFCNAVAAAVLMPREAFLSMPIVAARRGPSEWDDTELRDLGAVFGASREAVLRRLLTFGRTTEAFYRQKRAQYLREYQLLREREKPEELRIPQHIQVMSRVGRGFGQLVLQTYHERRITLCDVAAYLGMQAKNIGKFESLANTRPA